MGLNTVVYPIIMLIYQSSLSSLLTAIEEMGTLEPEALLMPRKLLLDVERTAFDLRTIYEYSLAALRDMFFYWLLIDNYDNVDNVCASLDMYTCAHRKYKALMTGI